LVYLQEEEGGMMRKKGDLGGSTRENAKFWNEVCGTSVAKELGVEAVNPKNLGIFDRAYMGYYPYLRQYVEKMDLRGKKVLEVGLGYGTLGQELALRGGVYHGVDVADNPVILMRYRLINLGKWEGGRVQVASVLSLPFKDESFDYVYSIGCLHHVGDLERAVSEVYRVLRKKGRAVVMLYKRNSWRYLKLEFKHWLRRVLGRERRSFNEMMRFVYDHNTKGEPAPYTEFVSGSDVKGLFRRFSSVKVDVQNFDNFRLRLTRGFWMTIPRRWFLGNLGRILGRDLYIVADRW
jgi:ubiquinone/menaquinone biosynthesis C-methylase UbiE